MRVVIEMDDVLDRIVEQKTGGHLGVFSSAPGIRPKTELHHTEAEFCSCLMAARSSCSSC